MVCISVDNRYQRLLSTADWGSLYIFVVNNSYRSVVVFTTFRNI